MKRVEHTLEPVYSKKSNTLILGSMPSVKSREKQMYYGNKTNRFWTVLEAIYAEPIGDWKEFIIDHNLALWDVIESCDIDGSKDSSIKNVKVNDIKWIIDETKINRIFLLGKEAYNLYYKYIFSETKIEGIYLPSPSAANASYTLNDLIKEYSIIKK